jgi:hypothetical protein
VRQEVSDHEGEVVEGEVGGAAQGADHGALLVGGLPGQPMRPGRMVETVLGAALAPLADGLGADAKAPGQNAGGLAGAGDLGTDRGRATGMGMDLQHGSSPSGPRGPEAFEAVGILYNGSPDRIPIMSRDLTAKPLSEF